MCQLTMIDGKLPGSFVRHLIQSNALEGHLDGFGYYLFDTKEHEQTETSALQWFAVDDNSNRFLAKRNVRGIYHVRRASVYLNKPLLKENAHPFIMDNTVLAHNGTLNAKVNRFSREEEKEWDANNFIDSQRFLWTLNRERGNDVLTYQHIVKTMQHFTGSFAFLIHDLLNPTGMWVVRGATKNLHRLDLFLNGERYASVINTSNYMATMAGYLATSFILKGEGISFSVVEIPKESVSFYKFDTKDLIHMGDIKEFAQQTVVNPAPSKRFSYNEYDNDGDDDIITPKTVSKQFNSFREMFNLGAKLGLTNTELSALFELYEYTSLFTANEDDVKNFIKLLFELKSTHFFDGRHDAWKELRQLAVSYQITNIFDVYTISGITFPYFLSTKGDITNAKELFTELAEG